MTYIGDLRNLKPLDERKRIADRLLAIKKEMNKQGVPERNVEKSLLLATFNIRDFDSNKFGHGRRLRESIYYLAEMIAAFDLVALQEVNDDLTGFKKLMRILGKSWDYIATDPSGNNERMVFVYDTAKVSFKKIAGEIVLPYKAPKKKDILAFAEEIKDLTDKEIDKRIDEGKQLDPNRQFNRSPFMVSFQSGWFKFNLCTVHIYYGESSGTKLERRKKEIRGIAKFLKKRSDKEKRTNFILLGDFNIVSPEHETMEALTENGFVVPEEIQKGNVKETMFYDQIAFRMKDMALVPQSADVFTFNKVVFRDSEFETYKDEMVRISKPAKKLADSKLEKYYRDVWRTFQISDHKIMWVELQIDFSEKYLEERKKDVLTG